MGDTFESDVANEVEERPQWYYRDGEDVFGPYTLNELAEFIREGRIGADDQVWLSTSPHWVRADRVLLLFRLAGCTPETAPKQPIKPPRVRLSAGFKSLINGMTMASVGVVSRIRGYVADIVSKLTLIQVLFLTAFFVTGSLAWYRPDMEWISRWIDEWRNPPAPQAFALYETLWEEARVLKDNDADDEQWDELESRAQYQTRSLLKRVKKTAGSSDRIAQLLLWAGRDDLIPMIESHGRWTETQALAFEEHWKNAGVLLDGDPLDFGVAKRRKALGTWVAPVKSRIPVVKVAWKPGIFELMLVLGVGFVVTFLWWRRRRA